MSSSRLSKYRIAIVDQDRELGDVLSQMLQNIGFSVPYVTRSGREAFQTINHDVYDFLITEWNIEQLNGIDLIKRIRQDKASMCPTLPIIMLTGRAEKSDVITARDAGVNEYVIKPFSAKAVYNRIERIVEKPRNFVVADRFIGPDRRSKSKELPEERDRRTLQLRAKPDPANISATTISTLNAPCMWAPDYSLKSKLGAGVTLQSIITPELLEKAQLAIYAITQDSLEWIKNDFQMLELLTRRLESEPANLELLSQSAEAALSISSRAGTFGYDQTATISYMLYLFCRNKLRPGNKTHAMIVQKHVDVLYVIMGQRLLGTGNEMTSRIIEELRNLTEKLGG